MENNKRNHTLDALKVFSAIMIILVHFPFEGELGHICSNIGICGVILFFLISGYSSYNSDNEIACSNILRRFKRNGITLLIVLLIYFIFAIIFMLFDGNNIFYRFKDPWRIPRILLLGDFSFMKGDPLWFMVVLLWGYLILYLLHKFKAIKIGYILLPLLLLFRIFVECYVNTYNTDWHYSSFFLASGVPIMMLGSFIACKKEAFLKAPLYVTIILTIISTALMFVFIHVKVFNYDIAQIFKIWCMLEIFILALKLPREKEVPALSKLGRTYSAYIYLFHFVIVMVVLYLSYLIGCPYWFYDWVMPIIAVIAGVTGSILLYMANNAIKNKINNNKQES